jgi:hypothetical protein
VKLVAFEEQLNNGVLISYFVVLRGDTKWGIEEIEARSE